MTKKEFENLIQRLRYQHRGEGSSRHITADPIFLVQKRMRIYGIEYGYADGAVVITEEGDEYQNLKEFFESLNDGEQDRLNHLIQLACDDEELSFHDAIDNVIFDGELVGLFRDAGYKGLAIVGYKDLWEVLNCHLTKEGAEAFIERKGHEYPRGLRIWVDSLFWCFEFRDLLHDLMDGKIVYREEKKGQRFE